MHDHTKEPRRLERFCLRKCGIDTSCVRAGETDYLAFGGTTVPIILSVAFGYNDMDAWLGAAKNLSKGYIYSRNSNPTVHALEKKMSVLERADAAVAYSSGMAAISTTLLALAQKGDRIAAFKDLYGGTLSLFREILPRFGIETVLVEPGNMEALNRVIARGCRVVYVETPTNPLLRIVDLRAVAYRTRKCGALMIVDNTLATPVNQRPIELGADIVIHSATKFLAGHGDAIGGVVCGRKDLMPCLLRYREILGTCLDPHAAFLIIRGLKTLHLRVRRQNENALAIGRFLERHPRVKKVHYPGIEGHPNHRIASCLMNGFGSVLSFEVCGGRRAVKRIMERLKVASRAANIGAVETLVGIPATSSHLECTSEERAEAGIPEGLIRYSAGIEDVHDLLADLKQALKSPGP